MGSAPKKERSHLLGTRDGVSSAWILITPSAAQVGPSELSPISTSAPRRPLPAPHILHPPVSQALLPVDGTKARFIERLQTSLAPCHL